MIIVVTQFWTVFQTLFNGCNHRAGEWATARAPRCLAAGQLERLASDWVGVQPTTNVSPRPRDMFTARCRHSRRKKTNSDQHILCGPAGEVY